MTCLLMLLALPIVAVLRGWVLSVLWGWFVVPFTEWPQISIPVALGISFMIGLTAMQIDTREKDEKESIAHVLSSILWPLFTLGCGWVVHLFM